MAEGAEVPVKDIGIVENQDNLQVVDPVQSLMQRLKEVGNAEQATSTPILEHLHNEQIFPTSNELQQLDWEQIVARIDQGLNQQERPSQELVDILMRRYILETLDFRDDTGYSFDPEDFDYSEMQNVLKEIDDLREHYQLDTFKGLPEEHNYEQEFMMPQVVTMTALPEDSKEVYLTLDRDDRYYKGKFKMLLHVFNRLSVEDQATTVQELVPYLTSRICTEDEIRQLRDTLDLDLQTDELRPTATRAKLHKPIIDFLVKNRDQSVENTSEEDVAQKSGKNITELDAYWRINSMMDLSSDFELLLEYTQLENFEEVKSITGLFIWPETYPYFINDVREALERTDISETQRKNLTMIGRGLLGADPYDESINFFTQLNKLYNEMKFEHYKPNELSTIFDSNVILSVVETMKRKNPKLFQIGVGTGRHFEQIEKMTKDWPEENKPQLMGLDANERHVEVAKQKVSEAVKLFTGSWLDLPVDDESLDMIVSLGRDLPHAENAENFLDIFVGAYNKLKPGGIFLFDHPNPLKGAYPFARERVKKAMELFGVKRHLIEHATDFIIDGPEEGKLYNRFAPVQEKVIEDVELTGATMFTDVEHFYCAELIRVPIEDGHGSENVIYIAYKPEDNSKTSNDFIGDIKAIMESDQPIEERVKQLTDIENADNNRFRPALLSMRDQILLSLSERLKGDELKSQ